MKQNCLRDNWDINFLTDSKHGVEVKKSKYSFQCNCKARYSSKSKYVCYDKAIYMKIIKHKMLGTKYNTMQWIHCNTIQAIPKSDSIAHRKHRVINMIQNRKVKFFFLSLNSNLQHSGFVTILADE